MRKLIILLIIILHFVQLKAQTSIYHPFPDSNAVWRVNLDYNCLNYPLDWMIKFQYKMYGDTIIGIYTYKKVKREGDCCLELYPGGPSTGYIGSIRDDIINKKIYIILKDSANEMLFYDFDLAAGDTLFGLYARQTCPYNNLFLVAQSVDSIFVDNNYRKRINFISQSGWSIIEGIGSNVGLFEGYPGMDCCSRNLVCFKVNENIIYPDTATSFSCDLLLENTIILQENNKIRLFPNPTTDNIIAYISPEFTNGFKISCIDILGREINIKYLKEQEQIILLTSELKEGLYFLSIYNSEKNLSYEKIIINH